MSVAVAERPAVAPQSRQALRPVISFHGVTKVYPSGTVALRDVDLAIHQGDFCFLVGASGAGKSTLVRLLIRDETTSTGRIFVEGSEISRMPHRKLPKLRRRFGIVFQDYKLLINRTVAQNVAFALQVTRPGQRHLREKVEEVLWIVGLEDKLDKYPDELSGGEQQRVAIAPALVHRPRIFIAHEPTGNLGVSLAGVFTMGLILFLVGGALIFTHSVQSVLEAQQANASHIKIYLSDGASLAEITDFETRLQHDGRVITVHFENKDEAQKE